MSRSVRFGHRQPYTRRLNDFLIWTRVKWSSGTKAWIVHHAVAGTLCQILSSATSLLTPYSNASLNGFGTTYLLDSGMTKVYAAVAIDLSNAVPAQDVLIYDARVGAALGLLTRYYLEQSKSPRVPAAFLFPRDHSNRNRDPSKGAYRFPSLNSPRLLPPHRAAMTRFAAKCIQQLLKINGPSVEFIKAEQALFMMGYNVVRMCCGCSR